MTIKAFALTILFLVCLVSLPAPAHSQEVAATLPLESAQYRLGRLAPGVRYQCAQMAVRHLDSNGLIILDNSDWLPASAMFLRQAELIEVDLSGPVPGNSHTQTTSFFFTRGFNFRPAASRQPKMPVGGRPDNWEKALEQSLKQVR